ncbi:hypothetical protein Corgl_0332 [Coriobacterium glomerans PW2]|uniref:Uncharacterized protein n=1 Tax=Coriobacterium glomerans (strain ATCC 49209 / DSM 20642 / JCM 10262 / PW2) TaxID=700015 RepID=F2NA58_CORGP|nr:ABC-three component system middle component 6 [Coriobacterium glomerans]AEB06452.1 hypothetical protein Corgl_0332 [Coriobacterium glomerans PW2]
MLLLDRNNEPRCTVFYLAAAAHGVLKTNLGIDTLPLHEQIEHDVVGKSVSHEFFRMALDFLYLLDRVSVDERGGLHVHQNASYS